MTSRHVSLVAGSKRRPVRGRGASTALAVAALLALAPASAAANPTTAQFLAACPRADQLQRSTGDAERLLRCLVDTARRDAGVRALRPNAKLDSLAARQVSRSIAENRLDHRTGGTLQARVRRSGYLRGAGRWDAGEALAAGRGSFATPLATVRRWLASHAGHRQVVLGARARDGGFAWSGRGAAGVGGSSPGATWALVTGWRR